MPPESPADRRPVGLAPADYVDGARVQYRAPHRTALAFVDWCVTYGLNKQFRIGFPKGGGLWFGSYVDIVTTSSPEEFSSVCGNWSIEPYPLSYGAGRKLIELEMRQNGLRLPATETQYVIPLSCRYPMIKFIALCFEKGFPIAGYHNNGVWWLRVTPPAMISP